jgi:hypothetical protein
LWLTDIAKFFILSAPGFLFLFSAPASEVFASFTNVTHLAGLDRHQLIPFAQGGGVALADYDNDGDLDLFLPFLVKGQNRFFQNNGNGTFKDITGQIRVRGVMGAYFADFDNDSDLDLLTTNFNEPNSLYKNNGDGSFTEVTASSGLGHKTEGTFSAAIGDYDQDGDLDIFVVNTSLYIDQFYLNNGDGTFVDVSAKVGLNDSGDYGLAVCALDFDNDGFLDIYVANDFGDDVLYHNNRDGTFTDVSKRADISKPYNAMGVAVGDYDNDLDLDLYVTNGGPNVLYRNNGDGTFTNVAKETGVEDPEGIGWGTVFFDYDNDGFLDLYVVNGDILAIKPEGNSDWPNKSGPNKLYRNQGNGAFEDVTKKEGVGKAGKGRGVAVGDIDNDGFLDIYVVNVDRHGVLYRNNGNQNHWLQIKPQNAYLSLWLGARVKLIAGGLSQLREIYASDSYLSQSSTTAHFGLGQNRKAEIVEISWPNGFIQRLTDIAADRALVVAPTPGPGGVAIETANQRPSVYDDFLNRFALYQNYPNPFNTETWIPFQLAKDAEVQVEIYDVSGRLVRGLQLGIKSKGVYFEKDKAAFWDGNNEAGEKVASGVYFYCLKAGEFASTKKMLTLK